MRITVELRNNPVLALDTEILEYLLWLLHSKERGVKEGEILGLLSDRKAAEVAELLNPDGVYLLRKLSSPKEKRLLRRCADWLLLSRAVEAGEKTDILSVEEVRSVWDQVISNYATECGEDAHDYASTEIGYWKLLWSASEAYMASIDPFIDAFWEENLRYMTERACAEAYE